MRNEYSLHGSYTMEHIFPSCRMHDLYFWFDKCLPFSAKLNVCRGKTKRRVNNYLVLYAYSQKESYLSNYYYICFINLNHSFIAEKILQTSGGRSLTEWYLRYTNFPESCRCKGTRKIHNQFNNSRRFAITCLSIRQIIINYRFQTNKQTMKQANTNKINAIARIHKFCPHKWGKKDSSYCVDHYCIRTIWKCRKRHQLTKIYRHHNFRSVDSVDPTNIAYVCCYRCILKMACFLSHSIIQRMMMPIKK